MRQTIIGYTITTVLLEISNSICGLKYIHRIKILLPSKLIWRRTSPIIQIER